MDFGATVVLVTVALSTVALATVSIATVALTSWYASSSGTERQDDIESFLGEAQTDVDVQCVAPRFEKEATHEADPHEADGAGSGSLYRNGGDFIHYSPHGRKLTEAEKKAMQGGREKARKLKEKALVDKRKIINDARDARQPAPPHRRSRAPKEPDVQPRRSSRLAKLAQLGGGIIDGVIDLCSPRVKAISDTKDISDAESTVQYKQVVGSRFATYLRVFSYVGVLLSKTNF